MYGTAQITVHPVPYMACCVGSLILCCGRDSASVAVWICNYTRLHDIVEIVEYSYLNPIFSLALISDPFLKVFYLGTPGYYVHNRIEIWRNDRLSAAQ